jgi:hypothetical protein
LLGKPTLGVVCILQAQVHEVHSLDLQCAQVVLDT